MPLDVSHKEGIQELVKRLSEKEKHLDILVNNAGAAWAASFDEFPENGWDKVVGHTLVVDGGVTLARG